MAEALHVVHLCFFFPHWICFHPKMDRSSLEFGALSYIFSHSGYFKVCNTLFVFSPLKFKLLCSVHFMYYKLHCNT